MGIFNISLKHLDPAKYQKVNNGFICIALIYFFFNSFLLPNGLLFTILLSPIFILWLSIQPRVLFKIITIFSIVFIILFICHYSNGIKIFEYFKSTTLYFTCVIFIAVVHKYFSKYWHTFDQIANLIIKWNIIFVIIALLTSIFWKKGNIFWYDNETASLLGIGRLKLFTSEASVYSLLLVPLFFYYFQYFYFKNFNAIRFKSLIIIGISLVLSTSYGAIGGIISSLSLFFLLNLIFFKRTEYNLKFLILFASLIAIAIVLILGPLSDSLIVTRVFNILGGEDSSVNGRSIEAISLAERVIKLKSEIFGVGPGQIKIVGVQIFSDFYDYSSNNDTTVRIPSAVGDTFAVFGYLGLITRFLLEIYLFIKTKVFSSSYRLCLFIFMFIFQFAGGDTADVVSYFIWTLSFTPVFPDSYFKSSRNHIRINDAEKGNFNNNCYI